MPCTHFYINRDILLPHDGVYSLDVHMNNTTIRGTGCNVTNCLKDFMTTVCEVFGTLKYLIYKCYVVHVS